MNLETLASVCSAVEADFSPEITVPSEMGTVETRSSKTLASLSDADKAKPLKEKTLKEVTESSAEKSAIEGHVGVNQKNGDGDVGETKIRGKEDFSGEKGLLEENGISLDDKESKPNGKVGSFEVPVGDVSENEDGEAEDSGCEGDDFNVGDFVWGKIRSHPWWPGHIYDASNASDFAAKMKHKRRHLVAYFGDGTFAWCKPSQLKPFEENFEEMSKQSNMKTFVSAVQQAVDEIGRVLELKMTCSCVPEENRVGLGRLVAENAGIKEGILVPEGKTRKLSDVLAEPSELLAELKRVAQIVHDTDVLLLGVLRSRVSAFNRAKGIRELPQYHDPVPVPGLEDIGKSLVKVPAQGPFEDWLPSAIDVSMAHTNQPLLQSCQTISENKKTPRRKQRSIADLIATEGTSSQKKAPPSGAKRKSREELNGNDDSTLTSLSVKAKKTKLSSGSHVGTSISTSGGLKKDETGTGKEETKKDVALKGRKMKKKAVKDFENDGGESKKENGDSSVSRNLRSKSGSLKFDDSTIKAQFEKSPSFRERKKSKYLSPPFTNVNSGKRTKDTEMELLKVSAEDSTGDGIAVAANQTVVSENLKSYSETLQNKVSTESGQGDETSHGYGPNQKTPIQNQNKIIGQKKADVSTNELLTTVRSAATHPLSRRGKKSIDKVVDFMSVFRDSLYRNGSNYKPYNKSQSRRKRKNLESESGSLMEKPKQPIEKSPKTKGLATVKSKAKEAVETLDAKSSGRRKGKQATATPETKTTLEKETVEVKALRTALFVSFGPTSTLPTKADLIRMYSKYGELDEAETDMFYNNFCARISFLNSANAESAYKDSQAASPFCNATVEFTLQYNSGSKSKTRELIEVSSKRATKSPKKSSKPQENGGEESDLGFIKQKLETVSSMLEGKDGKVSPTMKSKLKGEIKSLLEKVNTMVKSSSQE